jgi:flagellar M-ring protein FliF
MAERLAKTGIPHRLGQGGTEVLVPVAEVARARVALARDGLPSSGRPGLELFDKANWGMTDFTQRVTYQRALEGELARTIGGLRGIARAEVHLALPAAATLRRFERPASASVVLTLKSGTQLTGETVQGITYIVSNSVEGLKSDNVAVMDDAGRVLSVPAAGSLSGLATRQLDLRQTMEQQMAQKVEDLVATVVGTGRTRAEVAAELSFDQIDRTVERFDPDGQVLQTEQRSEGGGGGEGAVISNAYQNSRSLEKRVGAIGEIRRLTVAVLVDEQAVAAGGTALLARIDGMVRDAVGADSARGDRVSVLAVPFQAGSIVAVEEGSGPEAARPDALQLAERWSRPLVALAAIAALALIALRLISGLSSAATPGVGTPPRGETAAPALVNGAARPDRLLAEPGQRSEAAVQVLRAWLAETN